MTTWHCERRSQESGKENVLEVRESLQVSKLTEMLTCFGKDDDVPNRSFDFLLSVFLRVVVVVSLLGFFCFFCVLLLCLCLVFVFRFLVLFCFRVVVFTFVVGVDSCLFCFGLGWLEFRFRCLASLCGAI